MASARFSTKGQIVVPKRLRDAYDFGTGREVEFVPEPDGIKLRAKQPDGIRPTTLAQVSGMLAGRWKGPPLSEAEIKRRLDQAMQQKWKDEMGGRS